MQRLTLVLLAVSLIVLLAQPTSAIAKASEERGSSFAAPVAQQPVNIPLLYWPLPEGNRKITSYPNHPWTWAYLGLTGSQCPPAYRRWITYGGRSIRADEPYFSEPYWRNPTIPYWQDRSQADPAQVGRVNCYSADPPGVTGPDGKHTGLQHEGTDINGTYKVTPVYATANGKVAYVSGKTDNHVIGIDHSRVVNGKVYTWRVRYTHVIPLGGITAGVSVVEGESIAYVGNLYHLHFEIEDFHNSLGVGCTGPSCIVNPWGGPTNFWIDANADGRPDISPSSGDFRMGQLYWDRMRAGSVSSTRREYWPIYLSTTRNVRVEVTRTSGNLTPRVILRGKGSSSTTEIMRVDGSGGTAVLRFTQGTGNYNILVESLSGSGNYTIVARQDNGVVLRSRNRLYWDRVNTGNVDTTIYEYWPFYLSTTRGFTVEVARSGGNLEPRAILQTSTGQTLTQVDGSGGRAIIISTRPVGSYRVQVQPIGNTGGSYTIVIRKGIDHSTPPATSPPTTLPPPPPPTTPPPSDTPSPTQLPQNLLPNPGFEAGKNGWYFVPSNSSCSQAIYTTQSGGSYEGSYFLSFGKSSDYPNCTSLRADVPLSLGLGQQYSAAACLRGPWGNTEVDLAIWGVGGGTPADGNARRISLAQSWTCHQITLTVGNPGHTTLRLEIYPKSLNKDVNIDAAWLAIGAPMIYP